MRKFASVLFAICGITFGLAAFPVYGQTNEIKIDSQPLKGFADKFSGADVDWTRPFSVDVEAFLEKDGSLDETKTRIIRVEGDQILTGAVTEFVAAVGASGWLRYLSSQGFSGIVNLSAQQTSDNFSLRFTLASPSTERARIISRGLDSAVKMALLLNNNEPKKLGDDERNLLKGITVTSADKNVTIILALPAKDFQEMVKKSLTPKAEINPPTGK